MDLPKQSSELLKIKGVCFHIGHKASDFDKPTQTQKPAHASSYFRNNRNKPNVIPVKGDINNHFDSKS